MEKFIKLLSKLTYWIEEQCTLLCAVVTIIFALKFPTSITSFCCGGCVALFLLSTVDKVLNKTNKDD